MSDIQCSSTMMVCIDTSINKWGLCTSPPWERPINMLSKSSRSLRKRCDSLGPGTPHSRSRARATPTYRKKGRENMDSLRTTGLGRKQRRTMERQRNTQGSGVNSIRSIGITQFIVAQRNNWWQRRKPLNRMWVPTQIQNQKMGDVLLT
jgi:hypothetical protein